MGQGLDSRCKTSETATMDYRGEFITAVIMDAMLKRIS